MPDPSPTWEEVLASFEANAVAAEALIAGDTTVAPAAVSYDVWQLGLPPLPDELRVRAGAIHRRQEELADKLRMAMRSVRQQESLLDGQAPARRPVFMDQRL